MGEGSVSVLHRDADQAMVVLMTTRHNCRSIARRPPGGQPCPVAIQPLPGTREPRRPGWECFWSVPDLTGIVGPPGPILSTRSTVHGQFDRDGGCGCRCVLRTVSLGCSTREASSQPSRFGHTRYFPVTGGQGICSPQSTTRYPDHSVMNARDDHGRPMSGTSPR